MEELGCNSGKERESWDSKVSYILSLVGYAVGLGNIWRFPYLVQSNGGVVFLIPYFIMLAVLGFPVFYLELVIGQRMRKGAVGSWNQISPYLAGVGVSTGCICLLIGLYYNTILAWCISYMISVFQDPLPWADCNQAVVSGLDEDFRECNKSSATQYYWYRRTLDASTGIDDPGNWNWNLFLYLVIAWILVWLILVRGIKYSGKVVYFTALLPYVVLLIFLVRCLTLEGMENGYKYLFTPDWTRLKEPSVWMTAATQIFFSLGVGCGVLTSYASYLPPRNNCFRDAIMVATINSSTSMLAAIVIFGILGFKGTKSYNMCMETRSIQAMEYFGLDSRSSIAFQIHSEGIISNYTFQNIEFQINATGLDLQDCVLSEFIRTSASGTGLIFIVFTEAVNQFPAATQVFAFLFFFMILNVGLDSSFGTVEGAISCFLDLKANTRRWIATTIICGLLMTFSVIFAFGWGIYMLRFFDEFTANWPLLLISLFESVGIAWVYGLKRFSYDIKLMTGKKPPIYLLICWKFLSPCVMIVILIVSLVDYFTNGLTYEVWDRDYGNNQKTMWPGYSIAIGFTLTIITVMWLPLIAIFRYFGKPWLKDEVPAHFPEAQLRVERNWDEQNFSKLERLLYGKDSESFDSISKCPIISLQNITKF